MTTDAVPRATRSTRHPGRRVCLVALVLLAACAGTTQDAPAADGAGRLTVFAATSLADAFDELATAFEGEHQSIDIALNIAGSQTLAHQIGEGAPADVFASADPRQMAVVAEFGGVDGEARPFAINRLAIAVEAGNPHGVAELADLAAPELLVVLPAEEVPAGRYARDGLAAAGVELRPASLEQDVRFALAKVELGEADAAIVYETDVLAAAGRVDGVAIPDEHNVSATYPIAVLTGARNPVAAQAFVDFVLSGRGQDILAAHGFTAP